MGAIKSKLKRAEITGIINSTKWINGSAAAVCGSLKSSLFLKNNQEHREKMCNLRGVHHESSTQNRYGVFEVC